MNCWLYVQSTGALYRPDGSLCCSAYSGHGTGLNNPDLQNTHNVGPIPVGLYTMGTVDSEKGELTIHLIPDPLNDMHGRSGLLIHGDNHLMNHTASDGCIVASRPARTEIVAAKGQLRVIARPVPILT